MWFLFVGSFDGLRSGSTHPTEVQSFAFNVSHSESVASRNEAADCESLKLLWFDRLPQFF
jgi:hypothetical protein